jgi:peptide deformylase
MHYGEIMESALEIVTVPDPRLLLACEPVTHFDENLRQLVTIMMYKMTSAQGVGLAAPQLGINKRVFVTAHTGAITSLAVYINPVLRFLKEDKIPSIEGCLSIPGKRYEVSRHTDVEITAQDLAGNEFKKTANGFEAIVCQHENDHLDGILINSKGHLIED